MPTRDTLDGGPKRRYDLDERLCSDEEKLKEKEKKIILSTLKAHCRALEGCERELGGTQYYRRQCEELGAEERKEESENTNRTNEATKKHIGELEEIIISTIKRLLVLDASLEEIRATGVTEEVLKRAGA